MSMTALMETSIAVLLAGSAAMDFIPAAGSRMAQLSGLIAGISSVAGLFFYLVFTSLNLGFPMIANMHGALALYSLGLTTVAVFSSRQMQVPWTRTFTGLVKAFAALLLAIQLFPGFPPVPETLQPILRSFWLVLHISLATTGEALFTCSFMAAVCWFFFKDLESRLGIAKSVRNLALAGFALYTTGALILGMVWAYEAWGTPWSWDPKETWALVTWFCYAVCLHLNKARLSHGAPHLKRLMERLKMVSFIIAFAVAMFALFGVNLIMRGLHSY
ncbi:MAG: hypothetical protein EHM28_14240 [Spirochaetaceae bacterium]|nr:MAG: hypothetical protein EHM28_14240 [Spirochaetaceae bacterium]